MAEAVLERTMSPVDRSITTRRDTVAAGAMCVELGGSCDAVGVGPSMEALGGWEVSHEIPVFRPGGDGTG